MGETQRIGVRGLTLAVDLQGDGAPVLFVHGFPLDRTTWRDMMPARTGRWRIAPDPRGMGLSEVAQQYAMAEYADDLAALLDTLQVPRAVVCGLSMGGATGLGVAIDHGDRLSAFIGCDTAMTPSAFS